VRITQAVLSTKATRYQRRSLFPDGADLPLFTAAPPLSIGDHVAIALPAHKGDHRTNGIIVDIMPHPDPRIYFWDDGSPCTEPLYRVQWHRESRGWYAETLLRRKE